MTTTTTFDELPSLVGTDLGYTEYVTVTQDRVNLFAEAANDGQWIHTDPERAASGPFGGAIAHGFLTLSLTIPFWTELLEVEGVTAKVNYGLDKVRFINPVRVGSRIRMTATIASVEEVKGGLQINVDQTVEIEGQERPALISRGIHRFYA
ncbi:MaoC family dehydratase [Subtercola sp. RTI3]|uniref:MaoC family dehydratase n=1 Tax=Subtercola sp. RTI3 TaxID=3048639 RepID=UPI002B23D6F8|nr:MaoC family dehydratase [Subtercola sp. RTI3]MEA9986915.1 MaoC family dehydratase [Subtercola sp. RTI3]